MRPESLVVEKVVSLFAILWAARIHGFIDGRYRPGDGRDVDVNLLMLLGR